MPNEERDTGFKVVDRRPFTEEGKRREEGSTEKAHETVSSPPAAPHATSKSAAAPARPKPAESDHAAPTFNEGEFVGDFSAAGPVGFDTLVSYLSTTAMFQLGFLPGPGGERIPVDLVNARRTIDLMEVLQAKTEGNLADDEIRMLEEVLYELRMSYVEVQRRLTQTKK